MAVAANALTTYATVKAELGLTDDSQQATAERLIDVASDAIERYCSRKFQKQTVTDERCAPVNSRRLVLKRTPVASLTSFSLNGAAIDMAQVYLEDAGAGIVYNSSLWTPADLTVAFSVTQDPIPGTGERYILASYVGGYVLPNDGGTRDLPYDLEEACIDTVVSLYRRRGQNRQIASEAVGDASVTYRGPGEGGVIPDDVLSTLDRYRRRAFA